MYRWVIISAAILSLVLAFAEIDVSRAESLGFITNNNRFVEFEREGGGLVGQEFFFDITEIKSAPLSGTNTTGILEIEGGSFGNIPVAFGRTTINLNTGWISKGVESDALLEGVTYKVDPAADAIEYEWNKLGNPKEPLRDALSEISSENNVCELVVCSENRIGIVVPRAQAGFWKAAAASYDKSLPGLLSTEIKTLGKNNAIVAVDPNLFKILSGKNSPNIDTGVSKFIDAASVMPRANAPFNIWDKSTRRVLTVEPESVFHDIYNETVILDDVKGRLYNEFPRFKAANMHSGCFLREVRKVVDTAKAEISCIYHTSEVNTGDVSAYLATDMDFEIREKVEVYTGSENLSGPRMIVSFDYYSKYESGRIDKKPSKPSNVVPKNMTNSNRYSYAESEFTAILLSRISSLYRVAIND